MDWFVCSDWSLHFFAGQNSLFQSEHAAGTIHCVLGYAQHLPRLFMVRIEYSSNDIDRLCACRLQRCNSCAMVKLLCTDSVQQFMCIVVATSTA
jgi:hypothetical protein